MLAAGCEEEACGDRGACLESNCGWSSFVESYNWSFCSHFCKLYDLGYSPAARSSSNSEVACNRHYWIVRPFYRLDYSFWKAPGCIMAKNLQKHPLTCSTSFSFLCLWSQNLILGSSSCLHSHKKPEGDRNQCLKQSLGSCVQIWHQKKNVHSCWSPSSVCCSLLCFLID